MTRYWEIEDFVCHPPFRKFYSVYNTLYIHSTVRDQTQPRTP
jgi:hypothetical protein